MLFQHLLHAHLLDGQDLEPGQSGPDPILFADVVGAGAEGLLPAQLDLSGIEEVSEELPAGRCLEAKLALGLGH